MKELETKHSYSLEDKLKELINHSEEAKQNQKKFDLYGYPKPSGNKIQPIDNIKYAYAAFINGAVPAMDTILYLISSFGKYIDWGLIPASGSDDHSLDRAFGLLSKPKSGNPSKQSARKNIIIGFLWEMVYLKVDKKFSMEKAAYEVIKKDNTSSKINPDSLVRLYKREGCKKWEAAYRNYQKKIKDK